MRFEPNNGVLSQRLSHRLTAVLAPIRSFGRCNVIGVNEGNSRAPVSSADLGREDGVGVADENEVAEGVKGAAADGGKEAAEEGIKGDEYGEDDDDGDGGYEDEYGGNEEDEE